MMNMTYKNKLFDFVLTEALKEYMETELKEVDALVIEEPHEFSPQFEKKVRKLINSVGRKDRIKKYKRIVIKILVSVAAAFAIIFGGLFTQPEVFAAVQNVVRNVFDKYDKYEYVGEELTIENFDNSIRLGYVPDGYRLSEGFYSSMGVTLFYKNKTDQIIFEYGIADFSTTSHDNEHNSYSSFYFNDVEYHYYESSDSDFYDTLVWYDSGYDFSILAHLPKDELVKIAENIEK